MMHSPQRPHFSEVARLHPLHWRLIFDCVLGGRVECFEGLSYDSYDIAGQLRPGRTPCSGGHLYGQANSFWQPASATTGWSATNCGGHDGPGDCARYWRDMPGRGCLWSCSTPAKLDPLWSQDVRLREVPGPYGSIASTPERWPRFGDVAGLPFADGDGLLDEDVLPGVDGQTGQACGLLVWRRDIDHVDLPILCDSLIGGVATFNPVPSSDAISSITRPRTDCVDALRSVGVKRGDKPFSDASRGPSRPIAGRGREAGNAAQAVPSGLCSSFRAGSGR